MLAPKLSYVSKLKIYRGYFVLIYFIHSSVSFSSTECITSLVMGAAAWLCNLFQLQPVGWCWGSGRNRALWQSLKEEVSHSHQKLHAGTQIEFLQHGHHLPLPGTLPVCHINHGLCALLVSLADHPVSHQEINRWDTTQDTSLKSTKSLTKSGRINSLIQIFVSTKKPSI